MGLRLCFRFGPWLTSERGVRMAPSPHSDGLAVNPSPPVYRRSAVTLAQSGDGRETMTRPFGTLMLSSSLGLPERDHPFRCTTPWCLLQSRTKLSRSVGPPGFHGTDVVDDNKSGVGTAREPAVAVPANDLSSLGARRKAPRPAPGIWCGPPSRQQRRPRWRHRRSDAPSRRRSDRDARALRPARSSRPTLPPGPREGRGPPRRTGWAPWPDPIWCPPPPPPTASGVATSTIPRNPSQRRWSKGARLSEARAAAQESTQALVREYSALGNWNDTVRCPSLKRSSAVVFGT